MRHPFEVLNPPWSPDYRVPAVEFWMHNWGHPVVVVVPTDYNDFVKAMMPTDAEVSILSSYQEHRISRIYSEYYIKHRLDVAGPCYVFDDVNTVTFMKSAQTGAWHYYVMTWELHGLLPFIDAEKQYSDLVELLDHMELRMSDDWLKWKADHPEVFSRV